MSLDVIGKVDFDRFTVLKYYYGGPSRGSPVKREPWKSLRAQSQNFMEQQSPTASPRETTRVLPGVGCGGASSFHDGEPGRWDLADPVRVPKRGTRFNVDVVRSFDSQSPP